MNAKGTVHKFGDNVDTDVIIPARYLNTASHKELAAHCMEDIDQDFTKKCKPKTVKETYKIMQLSDKVLADYIIAKLLEAIVITVVIGIGLSILGVKYSFELALIIGILNVIPYIGFIIALIPTILIAIIYGNIELAIQTLIVTTILYIILTTFITPIIVGKKIKINILLMLSAMVLFGGMFGMIGMAIAAPAACIFAEVFKEKMELDEQEESEKKEDDVNTTNTTLIT